MEIGSIYNGKQDKSKKTPEFLRKALLENVPTRRKRKVLYQAIKAAEEGNEKDRAYLMDQWFGKSPTKIEHTGSIEHNYIKSIDNIKQQATKLSAIHITNDGISEDVS